jgi:hypothetical protein
VWSGATVVKELFEKFALMAPYNAPLQLDDVATPSSKSGVMHCNVELLVIKICTPQCKAISASTNGCALVWLVCSSMMKPINIAIDEESVDRAMYWCEFLESHANRIYGLADNQVLEAAQLIVDRKDSLEKQFNRSELSNKGWAGLGNSESIDKATTMLMDYGQLIEVRIETTVKRGAIMGHRSGCIAQL